jgi:hypothetical protein
VPGRFANIINMVLLTGSFGVGQGSIFLVQTWLLATGDLHLLAQFGVHFSFATLAILIVEAGSLTVLARKVALSVIEETEPGSIWQAYWETSLFRSAMCLALLLIAALYATTTDNVFSQNYVLFALPAFVIWSFNAGGMLDGLKLSGMSGLTGAIAYVASAVALIFAIGKPDAQAGAILGLALSLGYLLTVALQFAAISVVGFAPTWFRPTRQGVVIAAREGTAMLFNMLPGQTFFRVQIALSGIFLGSSATALLLYARQITAAVSQLIGFLRRVEFPNLVQSLKASPRKPFSTIFRTQRVGTLVAGVASAALLLGGLATFVFAPTTDFSEAGLAVALFAPGVFTGAIYLTLSQGCLALARFRSVALATNLGMVAGIALSGVAPIWIGVAGFALAEIVQHLVGGGWLWKGLNSQRYAEQSATS